MLAGQRATAKLTPTTKPAPVTIVTEPVYDPAKGAFVVVTESETGSLATTPVDQLTVNRRPSGNLV